MKRCGIIGQGTDMELGKQVYESIKKLIADGVTEFYSTGANEFCALCEKAARELGAKIIFVPYSECDIEKRDLSRYSGMICLFNIYSAIDADATDRWIAENCDVLL